MQLARSINRKKIKKDIMAGKQFLFILFILVCNLVQTCRLESVC